MNDEFYKGWYMGVDWSEEYGRRASRLNNVQANPHKGFDNAKDINHLVQVELPAYARANRECAQ